MAEFTGVEDGRDEKPSILNSKKIAKMDILVLQSWQAELMIGSRQNLTSIGLPLRPAPPSSAWAIISMIRVFR
ncbi:MAG: hypothetical protein IPJ09_17585 [Saprospiraceae bacterium]|nr:hypothetical protein [Saprospiraceae bacterium]